MKADKEVLNVLTEDIERVAKQLFERDEALASLSASDQVAARLLASQSSKKVQNAESTKTSGKPSSSGGAIAAKPAAAATNPAKADTNSMVVNLGADETPEAALARTRLHPVVNAGMTIRAFNAPLAESGFGVLADELTRHVEEVKAGKMNRPETILLMQAHTLDVIFNTLAQRAGVNVGANRDIAETYLRMALKAQAQCRTTLETLAEIKAPKATQFIKQQNVANQQQVNNGSGTPAHEKNNPNRTNELLEAQHGERLDSGAQSAAIGIDSQLETVGAVHRSKNKRRKNAQ